MKLLETKQLCYQIKDKKILQNISIEVDSGEIIALLGVNGSGKTTLIELLCNLKKFNSGEILFWGDYLFNQKKTEIGVLWDNPILFPMLKVKEIIKFMQAIYSIEDINMSIYNCLEINNLENSYYYNLSKGERKRVAIFLSVIHNPNLLILDEPTSDLDPLIRDLVWLNVFKGNERGILFTTHNWEEAYKYATKIYFIHNGKIISEGLAPSEHIERTPYKEKIVIPNDVFMGINPNCYLDNLVFQGDKHTAIYLKGDTDKLIEEIQRKTYNYTIALNSLEDIYQILIQ